MIEQSILFRDSSHIFVVSCREDVKKNNNNF